MKNARGSSGFKAVVVLLSAMLLFTGCMGGGERQSANQENGGNNEKQANGNGNAQAPAPTKLTVYRLSGNLGEEDFLAKEGWLMQRKYPNLQFEYILNSKGQTPEDLIASNKSIDIILCANPIISRVSDIGLTMDLSALIKKYNFDLGRLEPSTLEAVKKSAGGKLVGLPFAVNTPILTYNKDIFDKFGVPYPTDKMTWDDVFELSKKLTRSEGGTQYYGFGFNFLIVARTNSYAHEFSNQQTNKTTYGDDFWKSYFQQFSRFFQLPGYSQADQASLSRAGLAALLKNPNIAMFQVQNNAYLQIALAGFNFDFVRLPTYGDLPGVGTSSTPDYMLISSNSTQKDATFAAIAGALSDESQMAWSRQGNVSPLKSKEVNKVFATEVAVPELKGKNMQALVPMNMAAPLTLDESFDAISNFLDAAFNSAASGKQDVNTALREAQEKADQALAQLKSR
jgi:multiple sugar transport system substrate-binding protein